MASEYSIWLLPCAADAALLQGVVEELSGALGSPGFTPHLTIQGDIALPRQTLQGALVGLAARASVQRWRVAGLEQGQHFFPALALQRPLAAKVLHHAGDGGFSWLCVRPVNQPVQMPEHAAQHLPGHGGAALGQRAQAQLGDSLA